VDVVREIVDEGPVAPEDINAVGVAGHGHGLYLLDADRNPVRPGIRSTDSRAVDLVKEWNESGVTTAVREKLGYEPFAADPLSLLAWLRRHEPEAYDSIDQLLFCKDYLKYRLTGRVRTDEMEGSVFYDPDGDLYARHVFDLLGLESASTALPDVVPSWESCGGVTERAAEATGLVSGTPVASGLHDVGAVALGAGAYETNQGVLIVGTWGQSIVVRDSPATADDSAESTGLNRRYLDKWLCYMGNRSAAACVDWFVEECGDQWRRTAEREGVDPHTVYNRVVEDVPAGANGLLFHPYLDGSTDDPGARGGFYGLTATHKKADMLRAIYEGVAVAQIERLTDLAPPDGFSSVRLSGGGARSEVWSEMFSDVLDGQVVVPSGEETGARGAAICAALAAGVYPDHETAVERMVSIVRRHEPEPRLATRYRERRQTYEEALLAIRPTWKRLRSETETGDINE